MTSLHYVGPEELKRLRNLEALPERRAALFADACRVNVLYMIARAGSGHIGTSFSALDILSWLFLEELELPSEPGGEGDALFSSKGHDAPALYAVLAATGRLDFELIHSLRRLGGLPGHPDVSTPWIVTNTGPLGMGISKAKGMVYADRLLGQSGRVFVITGDGELQEGQIWESLATAVRDRMGEIVAIVDRNKIQSDTWVDEVSALGDLEAKFRAFGWHAETCDGHDIAALARVLERFRGIPDTPKVLVADTLKGRGVSFMEPDAMDAEERMYRYHSGAPSVADYEAGLQELVSRINRDLKELGAEEIRLENVERPTAAAQAAAPQRLVPAYSRALIRAAERDRKLVALDADLVLDTGLIPFRDRFSERFFECGIAEQDMVSQAGAMALKGLLPVVHSFACFLTTRPNEQIYNNATEHSKVLYVGSLAGLLPSGPGHSHQSVRDITAIGGVPGLLMVQPATEAETEAVVEFCTTELEESAYIRLVSVPVEVPFRLPEDHAIRIGHGTEVRSGKDGVIISYGPVMLTQAYRAAERLAEDGVELAVVDLPWLNRVDPEWLRELATTYPFIFTLDDHYLLGGQGSLVLSTLAELRLDAPPRVRRFGLSRVPLCGTPAEVLEAHGLDADTLAREMGRSLK